MERSPYDPPLDMAPQTTRPNPAAIDALFFTVNATFALLIFAACVISIAAADNPFALIGGVIAVLPVGCYAVAEWICWYYEKTWLKRPLGILNMLLAAFFLFALASNVGEVLMADEPMDVGFVALFVLGLGAVAAYLGFCGWRRLRDSRSITMPPADPQDGG